MTRRRTALRLALLTATAAVAVACGNDDDSGGAAPGPKQSPDSLVASVGQNDEYVISLTDDKGTKISNLAAGTYDVLFKDESTIHNLRFGGGNLDEATEVDEVVERTASMTFEPGDYSFMCDPHSSMQGSFQVS
jgi:type IV pilus biogenesis protein CpaD/CtpE